MHHKCVNCGKIYEHASEEILSGCSCGGKLFYFVKSSVAGKKKNSPSSEDIDYFYEIDDEEQKEIIVFDIEAINIKSNGKYELDINSLMNKDNGGNTNVIYKYGDGKYSIDLDTSIKQIRRRKNI